MQPEHHNNQDTIYFYDKDDEFAFLSNFYRSSFVIQGKQYKTNEHYFQSQKFVGTPHEQTIIHFQKPRQAFQFAQSNKATRRANWEIIKQKVMMRGLVEKFKIQHLRNKLLNTGNRRLVEHTHNDKYWADGGGEGKGLNRLGILLMNLRESIRKQQKNT